MLFVRPTILRTRTSLATFLSILASMLVLTVTGAGPAFAFAGDLDPTFGNAGTVVTDIAGNDLGRAVAVLPDGRIVVVGTSALTDLEYDIEVAVYLPSGALDPGFSSDGKLTIDNSSFDFGEAVDVMTEGNAYKIIVGGCTSSALIDGGTPGTGAASDDTCGTGSQMIVAKVDVASGALDPTFGTGGIAVTTTPLIDAVGNALVVQPSDSKILIAGATSGAGRDFAVARFTSAGTIDSLWGVAGYVITDNPNPAANENDEAFGITLQFTDPSTFKVVVAGHSDESGLSPDNYNIAAARYSNLGVLDAGFGAGGFKTTDVEPGVTPSQDFGRDVKIQPGSDPSQPFPGKIVVGGYTNSGGVNQFVAVRYDDNGPEDTTFSGDGKALVDVPGPTGAGRASVARAIDIQPNHKIVLTGASQASSTSLTEFAVVRLTRDGELDPTFSGDGKATTSLSAGADDAWDAVIQPDGKIVAAGFAGPDLGVARYYGDPVAFLSAPPPTTEGNSGLKDFIFTVTLSASSVEEVKLRFTTPLPDDSAVGCAPEVTATVCDYNRVTNTTVTFPAGVTSTTVDLSRAPRVQVRGDTVTEPAKETFDATITSLSGPAAVSPSAGAATATVLDDEAVAVSIGDYADFEGNDGTTKDFSFIVSQTVPNPSDVTTTVSFRTVPDTATSNVDYIARTGTVEIPAGQATSVPPVTVTVNGDNDATESDERFFVEITGVTCTPSCGAQPRTIGDGRGEGLIKDDDNAPRPQIFIGDVTAPEGNGGPLSTSFNFTITKVGASTETVRVTYTTVDCTNGPECTGEGARVANMPGDYEHSEGFVVFPLSPTNDVATATVRVNGDTEPEFDEIFRVTITATGSSAQVQDGEGRGTIEDDDGGGGTCSPNTSFFAYDSGFTGGVYVASGYVDGDACADIITAPGSGGGPHIRVFSGADGSEIMGFMAYDQNFTGGVRVAAGDVNGDGFDDIITAPGPGGGPHVRVFSGNGGGEIMGFMAYSESFTGGLYVGSGYVNNDNFADIVTGPDAGGGPHVRVFSGNGGGEIMGFMAYSPSFTGGVRVSATDVNSDGFDDVVVGPGAGGGPHVRVFSGNGGGEIMGFMAYDPNFTGGVFVGGGYVNNDAHGDVVTGPGAGGGPHVRAISGFNGSELASFFAYDAGFTGGVRVGSGDFDGNGLDDFVTGPGPGGGPHVRLFLN